MEQYALIGGVVVAMATIVTFLTKLRNFERSFKEDIEEDLGKRLKVLAGRINAGDESFVEFRKQMFGHNKEFYARSDDGKDRAHALELEIAVLAERIKHIGGK